MRVVLALILLTYIPSYAQTIDSFQTNAEVEAFLQRKTIEESVFLRRPKQVVGDSLYQLYMKDFGESSYEKADFDGNGYIDLLVNGYTDYGVRGRFHRISLVVFTFGNDSFQVRELSLNKYNEGIAARLCRLDGEPCIEVMGISNHYSDVMKDAECFVEKDTLTFVAGGFIEKGKQHTADAIRSIKYRIMGGLFFTQGELFIDGDSATLIGDWTIQYLEAVVDGGGTFVARIDPATRHRLYDLLQYVDMSVLTNDYFLGGTDAVTRTLLISYDQQKDKRIEYADLQNFGISAIDIFLRDIIKAQHWVRTKPDEQWSAFQDF